jgi:uncharacterized membrane protein
MMTSSERRAATVGNFRLRGTEVSRLEALSDAVFGFAITLLVVSLEVPQTFAQLRETMIGFLAFAASFSLLFLVWYFQHRWFRQYGLQDGVTIVLNGVLLFVVLFFVYPLKFVCSFLITQLLVRRSFMVTLSDGSRVPIIAETDGGAMMGIYGAGYVAVFAVFALLYLHAYRSRDALELSYAEALETADNARENLLNVAIGTLSIAFALATNNGGLAGWCYMLVGPLLGVHGWWSGRRRTRLLAEAEAAAASAAAVGR